jgi:anthranilate phosphoribosyltransferase
VLTLPEGVALAQETIRSGKARAVLDRLRQLSMDAGTCQT